MKTNEPIPRGVNLPDFAEEMLSIPGTNDGEHNIDVYMRSVNDQSKEVRQTEIGVFELSFVNYTSVYSLSGIPRMSLVNLANFIKSYLRDNPEL